MTYAEDAFYNQVKGAVDNRLWQICKYLRGEQYGEKATNFVCKELKLAEHTKIKDKTAKELAEANWCLTNKDFVVYLVNKRRNYVSTETGDMMVGYFRGSASKKGKKGGRSEEKEDEEEEEDGDGKVKNGGGSGEVGTEITITIPPDLPSEETILALAMRDPKAWGYNDEGELVDPEKQKKMDKELVFWWDKVMSKVCGQARWSPLKRCYGNLTTHSGRDGVPYVSPSDEAVGVFNFENHYKRWICRAKYNIKTPELLKYKKQDKTYLDHLKDLQGKYTDPRGGRQKFGGLTKKGKDRLIELINMIEENRKENADFIKSVEDRVGPMVYKLHGRDAIDAKRNSKGKKMANHMASAEADKEDDKCDMDDFSSW